MRSLSSNQINLELLFVAVPEKALLDLIYLEPDAASAEYLHELRLQHLESLNLERLYQLAIASDKPKLRRAVERITHLAEAELLAYEDL